MRLIDADFLKAKAFGKRGGLIHTSDIDEAPSVQPDAGLYTDGFNDGYKQAQMDAQPKRMRGRWIYGSPVTMKCDQCGYYIADWRQKESNFCPNCGADMRGGEQDEND